MATTLEHIYAIQNLVNKGSKSDDSDFTNRLVLHFMNVSRVLLLKRKADKKQKFDPSDFQSFCMPLCENSWINCPCLPDIDCPILKSKVELPKALVSRSGLYLTVRFLSGKEIGETTPSALQYREYSLTRKTSPAWFIDNNFIYIYGVPKNKLKAVYLSGVFIDPTEVSEITLCSEEDEDCLDIYESQYPLSGELIDPMYKMVLEYLQGSMRMPNDKVNNASPTEVMNDKEQ